MAALAIDEADRVRLGDLAAGSGGGLVTVGPADRLALEAVGVKLDGPDAAGVFRVTGVAIAAALDPPKPAAPKPAAPKPAAPKK